MNNDVTKTRNISYLLYTLAYLYTKHYTQNHCV